MVDRVREAFCSGMVLRFGDWPGLRRRRACAQDGQAQIGIHRGCMCRSACARLGATERTESSVDAPNGDAGCLGVVAVCEMRLHAQENLLQMLLRQRVFQSISNGKCRATCGRINNEHDAKVAALCQIAGCESGMVQQPEARFTDIEAMWEHSAVNCEEHLREPSVKIIKLSFDAATLALLQAVRRVVEVIEADQMIAQPLTDREGREATPRASCGSRSERDKTARAIHYCKIYGY